ncbi:uncharacterized protein LOC117808739 [Notolabrus celidotus]|uniref:uncharacterized protein LOC117808739 n=1 Tax=Notolabrus celidotus TaxID=1203425 RepID=UPI0014904E43|nr:uncharacterized protein LOC117808739 [Notolabrus celidotus]
MLERRVFSKAIIRHYSNLRKIRERELQEKKEREEALLTGVGASEPATTPGDETVNGGSGTTPVQPDGTTTPQPGGEGGETPEPEPTPGPEMPNGGVLTTEDDEISIIPVTIPPPPKVSLRFEQMSNLLNSKDVILNLVLSSESKADRPLLITISVQAMMYTGHPVGVIQKEKKEETLMPGKDLTIPIVVPFSVYAKLMLDSDSMKISALVKDKVNPDHPYLREHNVVLSDPPLDIKVST